MRVLIVEDEPTVRQFLSRALEEAGYEVDCALDGQTGRTLALGGGHDIFLLDIMLPELDGISLCRSIREAGLRTPVIFLSARGTLDDKIAGLDAGADDYLPKPFEIAELLARVRANLRRPGSEPLLYTSGPISLDPLARVVTVGGKAVNLSPTEFSLLEQLLKSQGRTVSRSSILQQVWKHAFIDEKVIDVYVSSLRKKLGEHGRLILTDRGVGYRICKAG